MKGAIGQNEIVKPGKGQAARAPAHCQQTAKHHHKRALIFSASVMAKRERDDEMNDDHVIA
jgi:ribonuclease HII